MYIRFPSIARSAEIGYALDTDRLDARLLNGRPLARWAREYQTYGDGLTVHSEPYAVQATHLADFCAGLAEFLLAPRDPEEHDRLFDALYFAWPRGVDRKDLAFVHGIRYDEKKPYRYYNLRERKVSSAESKRHDKRWEEIPHWADGSLSAMCRLLPESYSLLDTYRRHLDAYRFLRTELDQWSERPEEQLQLDREVEAPFEAVTEILDAWQGLSRASRIVRNYRRQLELPEEVAS